MSRSWFSSFNDAATGLVRSTHTQRNLRFHLLFACFVLALSLLLNLTPWEFALVTVLIGLVIMAELINSAIEGTVNLVTEHYHPLAGTVKDAAAAGVLVAAAVAFICGYLILAPKLRAPVLTAVGYVEKGPVYVTALALAAVVLAVVYGKATFGKGQILRGGMPSGHAAVAFSLATAVALMTGSFMVMLLTFSIAVMVAQSRLIFRIHTMREVVAGSLLGVLVTVLIFQLIR